MDKIRVFLSSPGDVRLEREIAKQVIQQFNIIYQSSQNWQLEIIAWDDPDSRTVMPVTMTPQEAIDKGLPKPSECDIVIVIFWGRIGTPLDISKHGTKDGEEPYWSGTEWEYLDAIRGVKNSKTGLPLVYVYRRTDTP